MNLTPNQPVQETPVRWLLSCPAGDGGPYTWWYKGVALATTTDPSYRLSLPYPQRGEYPVVEVTTGASTPQQAENSGFAVLCWYDDPAAPANRYRIERESSPGSGTWTGVALVAANPGGFYRWQSGWLDDDTTYSHRIVPIDAYGAEGTPLAFLTLVVRNPSTAVFIPAVSEDGLTVTLSRVS